jgi:hypothetical protein
MIPIFIGKSSAIWRYKQIINQQINQRIKQLVKGMLNSTNEEINKKTIKNKILIVKYYQPLRPLIF